MVIAVASLCLQIDEESRSVRVALGRWRRRGARDRGGGVRARCARRGGRLGRPGPSLGDARSSGSASSSPARRARSTTCGAPAPTGGTRARCWRDGRWTGCSATGGSRLMLVRSERERRVARGRRVARLEPPLHAPRAPRPAGLEERLRGGGVRLVLGLARRRAGVLVPRPCGAGRRARRPHGRGARGRRSDAPGAARRSSRPARCSAGSARRASSSRSTDLLEREPGAVATPRSARRCRATCADAPATRRSSTPCGSAADRMRLREDEL